MESRRLSASAAATLLSALGFLSASAQGPVGGNGLKIRSVERVTAATLAITFEETGDSFEDFKVETSISLSDSVEAWTELSPVTLEPAGENTYRVTVPIIASESRFFRIVGQGTSTDTDGDGVSNLDEEIYGTSPILPDTDEDGFSDSIEISAGTDPDNDEESPDYSVLPAIRFTLQTELIEEGDFTHTVLLEADGPVYGEVNYTISAISNAATTGAENDATIVTNTVRFSGQSSAEIQLTIRDDAEIEDIETLVFDLEDTEDGSYRTGAVDQHILLIEDNDALWTGTILNGISETSFRMLLIEEGGLVTGKIVNSQGSEGGVIPAGEWDLTVAKTSNSFSATSVPIPMTSSLLIDAEMERRLTIQVTPPVDPENIGPFEAYYFYPNRMVGVLTDELMAVEEDESYLNQQSLNLVVMVKETPRLEEIEVPNESE